MKEPKEDTSAVYLLAEDYKADLAVLRSLMPVIVSDVDVDKLRILAAKYGIEGSVTRKNYASTLGKLNKAIRNKLEELAIEHVLESERHDSYKKLPKKSKRDVEEIPEELQ